MAHVPSYQQVISNYVLCTVLSCSVSSKGHSFGGHKKMEEREVRIITFGVLLPYIYL